MTLVLRYAARSDRGLVRSNNQDSVYAGPRLLALADGMGGHAAGEVASKVVIAALAPLDDDEPGDDLLGELRDAVGNGNGAISELVASDPELEGMGTTLTAVLFAGNKLGLVNVGDSRAYLARDGKLTQITHDDTFVQSLIDEGRITAEEAESHPQRSLLLRALTGHEVEPTLTVREARAGDRYLLCSDGLSSVVRHETIAEAIQIPDARDCADRMIELALRGGGPDNVTVIVADVADIGYGEDAPIVGGAAGDGREDPPPPDSAAARAAAASPPPPKAKRPDPTAPPPPDPRAQRRKRLRALAITVGVLLLLVLAAAAGRAWVLSQYFIGANEQSKVVIFQGVAGSFLGLSLNQEVEGSCAAGNTGCKPISLNSLTQAGQADVRNATVRAENLEDAHKALDRLLSREALPPCRTGAPTKQPDPKSTAPTTTAPATPAPPTPVPPNGAPAPAQPSDTDTTSLVSRTPQPGVDCRTEG